MKKEVMIYHLKGWELGDDILIEKYKIAGFDSVAFYCNGQSNDEIRHQVEYARKIGLKVSYFHGPLKNNSSIWELDCKEYMNQLINYINLAGVLGIKYFVMHPSGKECIKFSKIGLRNYKALLNLCKKLNITLLLENLRMIGSMIFLLEKIKSHNLSVCLDFGHANVWCYSPMDLIKKYKNRIQGVHMHDNNGEVGNDQHLIPFQGKINWEKCVKALYKYYDGPISLEIDNFKTEEYKYDNIDKYLNDAYNSAINLTKFIWNKNFK